MWTEYGAFPRGKVRRRLAGGDARAASGGDETVVTAPIKVVMAEFKPTDKLMPVTSHNAVASDAGTHIGTNLTDKVKTNNPWYFVKEKRY